MSENNYRAYFFNNMYLTGIHAGIQAQHCTAEMFIKYSGSDWYSSLGETLKEWAFNHKTTIILNGGYASNLTRIENLLNESSNKYPWACFNESMDALEGCITSVGIILPEEIYDYNKNYKEWTVSPELCDRPDNLDDYGYLLADLVSSYRLMS
tara:strand:+ start:332 stop:790 length:459 start_codon:yes stop_codon:yes gene_type:complete